MIKIFKYKDTPESEIFAEDSAATDISAKVADIIAWVREGGDAALFELTERFDRVRLERLEVSGAEIEEACASVDPNFWGILERAAENIRNYHKNQIRKGFRIEKDGVVLGQKVTPIEKVGVYVPGGTAPLASSVLMNIIPAKLAGCPSIIMCTPPGRDGKVNPAILAAAKIAGADRIFKVGGAQAIAAMAYGTETIPAVYMIAGPGRDFIAEAKRQVFGKVAIDMIAGPSEILIIADKTANPAHVAADLLSQAEHDRSAISILVTDSLALASEVAAELERQLELLPREETARASVEKNGKIIITESIEEAIELANLIAPEHLEVCVDEPMKYLEAIKNAGSIFLGKYCPEALGDYYAGPNHTLPTGGTAKFSSPLSVDNYVKKSSYIYYTEDALKASAGDVAAFAGREELAGHARSITVRCENKPDFIKLN
ncbi:MAG TPA: histidinol dehydrogenase [Clostridiales bacterium]|jgi:histidinol dehydrogenase|nr:histidinol dehydrogenase [Clostridiales bacterium]